MIKEQAKSSRYKKEWMRERRKLFLKDKHCIRCGSKDRLIIGWGTLPIRTHNLSMPMERLENMMREHNYPIYCHVHWLEEMRAKRRPELVHGTLSGYKSYKCRCILCKHASARARRLQHRAQLRKQALPLYQQGMSIAQIARELGARYDRIRYAIKREELIARVKLCYKKNLDLKKKHSVYNGLYRRSSKAKVMMAARQREARRVAKMKEQKLRHAKKEKLLAAAKKMGLI